MSEVFVTQSSLDLQREIIVHSDHGEYHLVLVEFMAKAVSYHAAAEETELSHVPGSSLDIVRVHYGCGENKASGSADIAKFL